MNGFRITILTLLCLSVMLMFYVVLHVVPGWQAEYYAYQAYQRSEKYDSKSSVHRQQMEVFDPNTETPEEKQARLEEEEAMRRNEISVQKAEENVVVEIAKRREEADRAAEQTRKAEEEAALPKTIGIVTAYDRELDFIMIRPAVLEEFVPGAVLAVRRKGVVVCEVVVDAMDTESGQVSATVKSSDIGAEHGSNTSIMTPAVGDEVIVSPFLSSADLRGNDSDHKPANEFIPGADVAREAEGDLPDMPTATPAQEESVPPAPAPQPDPVVNIPPAANPAPAAEPTPAENPAATPAPHEAPAAPYAPAADTPHQQEEPVVVDPIPLPDLPEADEKPAAPSPQPAAKPAGNKPSLPSLDTMLHSPLF